MKSPGVHERELSRLLNIPLSTLDYHLHNLKSRNLVTAKSDNRYTRYYVTEQLTMKDAQVFPMLRNAVTRKIILFLLLHPFSPHRILCNHIGLAPSTTSFHLKKLLHIGMIENTSIGRETMYSVKEPEHTIDLLVVYHTTFLDSAVDHFVETWLSLHPQYMRKIKKNDKEKTGGLSLFFVVFSEHYYGGNNKYDHCSTNGNTCISDDFLWDQRGYGDGMVTEMGYLNEEIQTHSR